MEFYCVTFENDCKPHYFQDIANAIIFIAKKDLTGVNIHQEDNLLIFDNIGWISKEKFED